MNKRVALFKAHVSFRVSNSYFRDKKTQQQFVSNVNFKNFQTVVTTHGVTRELISDANKNPSIISATIATTTRPAANGNMFIVPDIY